MELHRSHLLAGYLLFLLSVIAHCSYMVHNHRSSAIHIVLYLFMQYIPVGVLLFLLFVITQGGYTVNTHRSSLCFVIIYAV